MKILNSLLFEKVCIYLLMIVVLFIFVDTAMTQEQVADVSTVKNPKFESQLEELLTTLYCPCGCVRETNKACVCETAQMLETDFRNRLSKGETVDQIRSEYIEKYGSQFSAVMKAEGVNLIAYLMPALILLAIGSFALAVLEKSRKNKVSLTQPDNQISDELQQQVESELEKYKEQN